MTTIQNQDEVTRIVTMLESVGSRCSEELIPLVYEDLRRLARARLAAEPPGQTLQATALVHEAYLRIEKARCADWDSLGHFFGAAAESMRRIIIDNVRRKKAIKRGGDLERVDLDAIELPEQMKDQDLLAVDGALNKLEAEDSEVADLVKLRFFAGLTEVEAARALGMSERTARRRWNYARAWLFAQIRTQ